jgi:hypothetical protein
MAQQFVSQHVRPSPTSRLSLRVLPVSAGPHEVSVAGAFTMLDFPAGNGERPEPPTIYHENLTGALYLDRPAEISQYEKAWRTLDTYALSAADSVRLLGVVLKEWNDRE